MGEVEATRADMVSTLAPDGVGDGGGCGGRTHARIVLQLAKAFAQGLFQPRSGTRATSRPPYCIAHQLFASLARLEMDVVENCSVPVGSGNFIVDYANARDFGACCEAVAVHHGQHKWPGCRAYGQSYTNNYTTTDLYRCTKASSQLGLRPSDGDRWSGGAFGDYCFDFVRQGIYVNYLPAWFSSGLDVNLILSEELFSNPYGVAKRILKLIQSVPFEAIEYRLNRTLNLETIQNAKAVGPFARMPETTERELNEFYRTYNQKFTSIYLHRDPEWH